MVTAVLEMAVELILHQWPLPIILKGIRLRSKKRLDGAYDAVIELIRDSFA